MEAKSMWVIFTSLFGLFKDAFLIWYRNYITKKRGNTPDLLSLEVQAGERIDALCEEARIEVNCDRVYVSDLHNGTYGLNGTHMLYFSCIYESTAEGISEEKETLKGKKTTDHITIFKDLVRNNEFRVKDTYKIKNETTRSFLVRRGIRSHIVVPIFDVFGSRVATLQFDWVKGPFEGEGPEIDKLMRFSDEISKVMTLTLQERLRRNAKKRLR